MSFAAELRAFIRLEILQALLRRHHHRENHHILAKEVSTRTAHHVPEEDMRRHLSWLEDAGLVATDPLGEWLLQVQLTREGKKVAKGDRIIEGVAQPDPEI